MRKLTGYAGPILALGLAAALAGCDGDDAKKGSGQAPPPQGVHVVTLEPEKIPLINDLPGRVAPVAVAEVRPRVSGLIEQRVFEQGVTVEKNEVLFKIDPSTFQVQVDQAKAALQKAEAARKFAEVEADRQESLRERQVVSAQALDLAASNLAQATATVAQARAELAAAQLNLQYTDVRAPITGRIGRAQLTEGALVVANSAQPLATIQQLDPIYADFTQSAADQLNLRRAMSAGKLTTDAAGDAEVTLYFDDGSEYPHKGRLLFSEVSVDETTGQVTMRAEIPNPEDELLPGLYIRIRIEQGVQQNALAVPEQAMQRGDAGQAELWVLDENDVVKVVKVETDRHYKNEWVIRSGVSEGDRVMVDGFQKARPGAKVTPMPWTGAEKPGDAPAAAGGDAKPAAASGDAKPAAKGADAKPAQSGSGG